MTSAAPALPWPPQPVRPSTLPVPVPVPGRPRHAAPEDAVITPDAALGAIVVGARPGRHAAPEPDDAAAEWDRELYDPAVDGDPLDWLGFTAG